MDLRDKPTAFERTCVMIGNKMLTHLIFVRPNRSIGNCRTLGCRKYETITRLNEKQQTTRKSKAMRPGGARRRLIGPAEPACRDLQPAEAIYANWLAWRFGLAESPVATSRAWSTP